MLSTSAATGLEPPQGSREPKITPTRPNGGELLLWMTDAAAMRRPARVREDRPMLHYLQAWLPLLSVALGAGICFVNFSKCKSVCWSKCPR